MQELPKVVQHRLASGDAGPHPDPDLLTAFAENNLSERERSLLVTHLSRCFDCRTIIALAQPAEETITVQAPERTPWLRWPVLKWGTAIACVAIVGAAISLYREHPEQYTPRDTGAAVTTALQSPREEERSSLNLERKAAEQKAAQPARAASSTPKTDALGSVAEKPAKTMAMRSDAPSSPVRQAPESLNESTAVRDLEKKEAVTQGKAKQATGDELRAAGPAANAGLMDRKSHSADVSLASSLAPRWTLNADGTLQRSLDGGRTWNKIAVSSDAAFRVVAALGSDVWVGGAAASLFHSRDAGEHWLQVKPSDGNHILAGDITAIELTDSTHGRVTTSNDEVWSTEDGGNSWQQLW
ncbi:MAG TPA: YCF48-related protein [Terriglobales bacterium]|nr:YCF48-related protein [Terriglobales bacterium]